MYAGINIFKKIKESAYPWLFNHVFWVATSFINIGQTWLNILKKEITFGHIKQTWNYELWNYKKIHIKNTSTIVISEIKNVCTFSDSILLNKVIIFCVLSFFHYFFLFLKSLKTLVDFLLERQKIFGYQGRT